MKPLGIRPELKEFASRMEERLRANEARSAAPRTREDLLEDLRLCCVKFETALAMHDRGEISDDFLIGEGGDAANFVFILVREAVGDKS